MKQLVFFFGMLILQTNPKIEEKTIDCATLNYIFNIELPKGPFGTENVVEGQITILDKYHLASNCDSVVPCKSYKLVVPEDSLVLEKYYSLDSIIRASGRGSNEKFRIVYFSSSITNESFELIFDVGYDEIEGVGVNYINAKGEYFKKD